MADFWSNLLKGLNMKKLLFRGIVLSIGLVNILHGSVVEANLPMDNLETKENQQSINSLEEALKNESSGSFTSRFKGGYYLGIGYQGAIKSKTNAPIQGLLFEGGLYTLFNPIQNYFDIELGLNGKYNMGTNSESSYDEYHAGLKEVTIYSGLVFRFNQGKQAFSLGISKSLYTKQIDTEDMKDDNIEVEDIKNGLGAYIEYQYMSKGGMIGFTKLSIEEFDILSAKEKVANIIFGMKY